MKKLNKEVITVAAWRSIPWMVKKVKLLKKRFIKRRSRANWGRCLPEDRTWDGGYKDAMNEIRVELNKLIKEIETL